MEDRTTNLWIVINEETLEVAKRKNGKPAKFATEKEADQWASERLNMWQTFHVHFLHPFISHTLAD